MSTMSQNLNFDENLANPLNSLKVLSIFIDEEEIFKEDIVTYQIDFKGTLEITSKITIKDTFDLTNNSLIYHGSTIRIYAKDQFDDVFDMYFIITNVQKELYNNKYYTLTFEMKDEISYSLENTYLSKGFKDVKLADILKEYLDFLSLDYELEFDESEELSVVVPSDRNFIDSFNYLCKINNFKFYQTSSKLMLKSKDNLLPSNLEKIVDVFTNRTKNKYYMYYIGDISAKINNYRSFTDVPDTNFIYYNSDTKEVVSNLVKTDDYLAEVSLSDFDMSEQIKTNGTKIKTLNFYNEDYIKHMYCDSLINNNTIEIVVPGRYSEIDLFKKITLVLSGSIFTEESILDGEKFLSGDYVITEMYDRIVADKFFKKLVLKRLDFKDPS